MNFAVAGLLAVFAVCAQTSAVLPYTAWPYASPLAYHHAAPITQYSSVPLAHLAHAAPVSYAAHVAHPAPLSYAHVSHHQPIAHAHVYAAPAVVPVHAAASYTAANRGSVHTAPLPGHAISQTSLNLAPAPGTL